MLNDPVRRAAIGEGADTDHLRYIQLFNTVLRAKPPGMTVCTHLCRGNFRSAWLAEGSYEHVAEAMFSQLAVDGFFLEYDDARSGDFAPLRFVPRGRMVVLGLVTTKKGANNVATKVKRSTIHGLSTRCSWPERSNGAATCIAWLLMPVPSSVLRSAAS